MRFDFVEFGLANDAYCAMYKLGVMILAPRSRHPTKDVSPLKVPSLPQLRRYAIARSLFKATSLPEAIARLGFVQADPMRAPARAQDLILPHRVKDYRAGELERRYPRLAIEEAFFINYGFLPSETLLPMLWGEQMLGWANLKVVDGRLQHELGFAGLRPRGSAFQRALDQALQQMQKFLEL
jgi:uncharacterized protein YcaQ